MTETPDVQRVRDVLSCVAPERGVASTTAVTRGNNKQTAVVEFDDGETVVIQLSDKPDELQTEFSLAQVIRERTSLPVPAVVEAGCVDETGYVVVERAPGEDLHTEFTTLDASSQQAIARSFGRYLAELHDTFRFDGYGAVTSAENGSDTDERVDSLEATETTDWEAWFDWHVREGVEALPTAFDDLRASLRASFASATPVSSDSSDSLDATLFPWDFRPGNALVDDGHVSAVLDWANPLAAPAALSVAKTEHLVTEWYVSDTDPLHAAFTDGYRSVRPLPTVPTVYRLAAVVHAAVDSQGAVTRPRYPEQHGERAVAFHRNRLSSLLARHESETE